MHRSALCKIYSEVMEHNRIKYLLERYHEGNCTEDEFVELDNWYHDLNFDLSVFDKWVTHKGGKEAVVQQLYADFERRHIRKTKEVSLFYRYGAVAAILLIIVSALFYRDYMTGSNLNRISEAEDIAPGGNKAMLTLADGRKINLTDAQNGMLTTQNGVSVSKTADGRLVYKIVGSDNPDNNKPVFHTITTPHGGKYELVLPDGTKVWLNAMSSLSFPSTFTGQQERRVSLTGEGYFEVAKTAQKSRFIVNTETQHIEVLGTHFNIDAYKAPKQIKTTLLEGSVSVSPLGHEDKAVVLQPGQQASFNAGQLRTAEVDVNDVVAWKNGYFMFKNDNLEYIMEVLSRWYNAEVVFKDEEIKNDRFWGTASRSDHVSGILKVLERTGAVHFRIEENKIIVMK